MPAPPRRSVSPVSLGFASHVLAGLLPFLSAGAIARLGLMPGTASLYLAGTCALLLTLADRRVRGWWATHTASLLRAGTRRTFAYGLFGFLVAGVGYYLGLARSAHVAEYIFLTRLDWLVQAAFAIIWLHEPWTRRGLVGAALALAGGLMLAWSGAFGASGLAAAAVYIVASLVGYSCFKPLAAARGRSGAVVLTMWRHGVNTLGFVVLALALPGAGATDAATGLWLAGAAGIAIVVLFLLRFTALTGLPLWVLSAQAPTQACVAIIVTLATAGSLPATTLVAIGLIVVGEVLVTSATPA